MFLFHPSSCEVSLFYLIRSQIVSGDLHYYCHIHTIIVWCQEASNQGDRDIHRIYRIIVRKDCFLMQGNWGGEYFKVSTTGVQILYLVYPIVFREEGVAEVHGVMDWSTLYLCKSASENQWVLGGWWHTIERTLNAF